MYLFEYLSVGVIHIDLEYLKMVNPHKIIMVGSARATIFMNSITKDGQEFTMPKVAFEIRFKDANGRWQGTTNMTLAELPKAILALQKAQDFLLTSKHSKYA